ncbi:hypothetical protein MMC16_007921, partial [Acarospora aff. strigata]|nr:hypothetical protein [Acarospora aff. strigata]
MEEYEIQPENTYNMDEKGFLIGVLQKTKRVWSKSMEIRGAGQDVENDILRAEIQGLKRQVVVEKRRKICSKPLFDSIRDKSKGLILSLRKIQEAKELKIVKKSEKEKLVEEKALKKEEKRMNKEVNALKMVQKKEEKQQTQLQKVKEAEKKRAAKAEEKIARKVVKQVKKNLKKQLQRSSRKDSPIVIQKEVVVVAKSTTEVEEAV